MTSLESNYSDRNESPGFLLWRVSNRWQQQIRKALKPHDLTHVQFVLLAVLASEAEPMSQNALAAAAGTDRMMTSQVLRVLKERGLVYRQPDTVDRRAMQIIITPAGRRVANKVVPIVEEADALFFGRAAAKVRPILQQLLASEHE